MESQSDGHYFNPSLNDYLSSDLEKMKGDAIGNTLYSERSVLQTLIKITKYKEEDWNEDFESNLCSLWDMTLEKDVVNLLMEHDIFSIITIVLRHETNTRLTEIMVGIIGNMCCIGSVRQDLSQKDETCSILLGLFDQLDSHVLIQLVRLLNAVAWDLVRDSVNPPKWLESAISNSQLTPYLSFILKSSTNDELLTCVLEFLNTICTIGINDKDYSHYFATTEMVSAMLDAWQQLFNYWIHDEGFPSKRHSKAAGQWCTILASFSGHENGKDIICEFGDLIGNILFKIVHRPMEYLDSILISAVNLLDSLLPIYFNGNVLKQLLLILNILYQNSAIENGSTIPKHVLLEKGNIQMKAQIIKYLNKDDDTIENYCANVSISVSRCILNSLLAECSENHVLLFWKSVSDRQIDDSGERAI